jgi:DNA-binding CsgD family transcriptional regulator
LSTRGVSAGLTIDDFTRDLNTIIDRLALQRFILWGWGMRAHVAMRYAVLHPERVRGLLLHTCTADNRAWNPGNANLARLNWEFLLRSLASFNSAGMTREGEERLIEDYRTSVSQVDSLALTDALAGSNLEADVSGLKTPTLVMHQREHFSLAPEESIKLAAMIPGAQFVLLDTYRLFGDARQGLAAIDRFVAQMPRGEDQPANGASTPGTTDGLSSREIEVLRLLAAGRSNQQIADELVISLNTVRRHVSNVFDKTGAANRAQAAVYAKERGLA